MIFLLPRTVFIEFGSRYLVEIDKGHILLFSHLLCPQAEGLVHTHNLAVFVVCVTRSERHEYGICAHSTAVVDVFPQILAVCIYRLLYSGFLDGHIEGVLTYSGDTCPCSSTVVWAVVVMTYGYDYPVALLYSLAHIRPQSIIECSAAHSAESLVFHSYLVHVEEFLCIISPSPLSVVAVAQRSVAHGGIADKEEHRVISLAARSRRNACGLGLVKAVKSVVHNLVDILHRF